MTPSCLHSVKASSMKGSRYGTLEPSAATWLTALPVAGCFLELMALVGEQRVWFQQLGWTGPPFSSVSLG